MASMADIKHSIKSISETEQITRAMYLISKSKMRKAVSRYEANRTHFVRVQASIKDILMHTHELSHPYIGQSVGGKAAYVVIASDKGLCGSYNHNVLNLAHKHMESKSERHILTIGQVARAFFDKLGYMIDIEFLHVSQDPSLYHARGIARDILSLYDSGLMDEVYVVYTRHFSALKQEPQVIKLLPLSVSNLVDIHTETQYSHELFYHPSHKKVFDMLVPQYIVGLLYGCLVQSYVCEHSARMIAMENATDNAEKMIDKLSLQYNSARQSSITNEISEIIGAMDALTQEYNNAQI